MNKEKIKERLEEILLNKNIDNPYININVAADWIAENFIEKKEYKVDWIEEWTNLFPKTAKNNGQPIYSKPRDCLKKMQNFLKDYPEYEKDVIFAATKQYLREREKDNWNYTMKAINFIHHRDKGSMLASMCENYLQDGGEVYPINNENFFI